MPPRKRVRKRKRRNASSSSSDSSSSGSSSSDEQPQKTKTVLPLVPSREKGPATDSDSDSDSDTTNSNKSSSSIPTNFPSNSTLKTALKTKIPNERHSPPRSPGPPDANIPSMFPPSTSGPSEKEKELKEKFKKFWMTSIADAFKDELEEIRKEPNLTTSRMSLLIDALASGADVYASSDDPALNEMEIVLKDLESEAP